MTDVYYQAQHYIQSIFATESILHVTLLMFPFVLLVELPFYIIIVIFILKKWLKTHYFIQAHASYYPIVTIVVCAYSEKEQIYLSLRSLCEQIYPGYIEILVVVDDATVNYETANCVKKFIQTTTLKANRRINVIEKKTRGGLAHSRNIGLNKSHGEIILVIDADTSIENDCIAKAAQHFSDPNVVALSGVLRVRNGKQSVICRLQDLEYKLGIELSRYGLAELGVINNISGAFGFFRVSMLRKIGGWLNGTAEDLDLLLRIYAYTKRYPNLRVSYAYDAVAFTSVPDSFRQYLKQRLRWEGDLFFIYVRRHWRNFSGKLMGTKRMFFTVWYGLYYQIIVPFLILAYSIYLLTQYNLGIFLGVNIFVYGYYLCVNIFFFSLYTIILSRQPLKNLSYIPTLFIMPIFQLVYKLLTTIFLLNEILFKGHKKTNMAPWWIIKKTK